MVKLDPTEGSEQAGIRPVVVVSRDALNHGAINNNRTIVMVCIPLTDRRTLNKLYPCHVEISKGVGGLEKQSVVLCEQIRSIAPGKRLFRYMGRMPETEMRRIEEAMRITLALD